MLWTQVKMMVVSAIVLGMLGVGGGLVAFRVTGSEPPAQRDDTVAQNPVADTSTKKVKPSSPDNPQESAKKLEAELLKQRNLLLSKILEIGEEELDAKIRIGEVHRQKIASEEELKQLERELALERGREQEQGKVLEECIQRMKAELEDAEWEQRLLDKLKADRLIPPDGGEFKNLRMSYSAKLLPERLEKAKANLQKHEVDRRMHERQRTLDVTAQREKVFNLEHELQYRERQYQRDQDLAYAELQRVESQLRSLRILPAGQDARDPNRPRITDSKLDQLLEIHDAALARTAGSTGPKLDRLLQEVEALRREVRELKNTKREP